ncbi:TonB-dependent receptor [Altererythrobacter sp. RZ02]|uniref:TonB-dependent receptor n=1 Tax=Pontixanthobacter rizhaonensis TaxID=2730337 RepID=A0A848QKC9_9SPHN|nr:TonB-dependent receptor [Pontixanthobacter rizhaonensis]NMW31057.1 TonB-dependent receptor [Pontixanthobacter rizhaonensis]
MKRALLSSTAVLLAFGLAGTAQAQESTDADGASNLNDEDIIIVTATRRAADVQDIPIAVTAVTPEQLDKQGVVNVQNISQVSPSFSTSNAQVASGTVVLRIRGVGTTSNNIGFESAVGIFVDGAYQSRPGIALSEFVDIERVEVLRGPQGTLFGRNTSAGALNITTRSPDLSEFGGFVNATYGNYDLVNVQGAVNVPIVQDTLALRLTGAYRNQDGFVDVIDGTGAQIGESNSIDQFLVRGQLGFESDGGAKARLIFDYTESENQCCAAIEVRANTAFENTVENLGGPSRGGMATVLPATDAFDVTAAQRAIDNLTATASRVPLANTDQWGVTGEFELPIGDNADLIFIGSYRDFSSSENYDSSFSGLDVFDVDRLDTNIETFTAELRLQGDAFDGSLDWMIGGYYSDEQISSETDFSLGADYDLQVGALFGGLLGPAPLTLLTDLINDPLTPGNGVSPNGTTATNAYSQSSKSWSIFTHNTLSITDNLSLTLGLRYSDESKTGGFNQLASNNPTCLTLLSDTATIANTVGANLVGNVLGTGCFAFTAPAIGTDAIPFPLPREFNVPFKDDELIYTGKLTYEFDAPITAYASFTHGYKSGGINLDITANAAGADPTFRSELVDAYEVGVKAKFLDNAVTLNMAAFHEEFSDFQVLEFTGAQFTTFNVNSAKSTGVELESVIRPDDNLTFNLGLTYTNARYPGDCDGGTPNANVTTLCGNSLTNAPEIVAIAGFNYDKDFGNYLRGFFTGQARMESDRRTSTQARTVPSAAQITAAGSIQAAVDMAPLVAFDVQDGTTKINLRAGIGAQDESWTLEVWGVNVTDQVTRGVTFNTVLRGNSRSAFAQQPATYGVTVRTKF